MNEILCIILWFLVANTHGKCDWPNNDNYCPWEEETCCGKLCCPFRDGVCCGDGTERCCKYGKCTMMDGVWWCVQQTPPPGPSPTPRPPPPPTTAATTPPPPPPPPPTTFEDPAITRCYMEFGCPNEFTCCIGQGCCSHANGQCCNDMVSCCPADSFCGIEQGVPVCLTVGQCYEECGEGYTCCPGTSQCCFGKCCGTRCCQANDNCDPNKLSQCEDLAYDYDYH